MLTLSKDRKVTNLVNKSGKTAVVANAFGLPAGKNFSCPGATSFCEKICYAGKLEKIYKGVKDVLMDNYAQLISAGNVENMTFLISDMIVRFEKECDKREAPKNFRIHWDGDFFSLDYARAWANVIKDNPQIHFWVYTRSFTETLNVLPIITGIDNLTVYLSADPVNIALANKRASEYPDVFIATVADTFADARETIIDSSRKTYACPENRKSIPLISEKGSACARCGICMVGRGDVLFSKTKR